MSCGQVLREEFRLRNAGLSVQDPRLFYASQWPIRQDVFMLLRIILAGYCLYAFIDYMVTIPAGGQPFKYLTIWSFIILYLHLSLSAVLSVVFYRLGKSPYYVQTAHYDPGKPNTKVDDFRTLDAIQHPVENISHDSDDIAKLNNAGVNNASYDNSYSSTGISWSQDTSHSNNRGNVSQNYQNEASGLKSSLYQDTQSESNSRESDNDARAAPTNLLNYIFVCSWVLMNIAITLALLVTIMFWTFIYVPTDYPNDDPLKWKRTIHVHVVNSVLCLLDMTSSARPVRLFHVYIPVLFGTTYCVFNLVWFLGHDDVIYKIIDWNHPGLALAVIAAVIFIGCPMTQLFWFGTYRLNVFILHRCCSKSNAAVPQPEGQGFVCSPPSSLALSATPTSASAASGMISISASTTYA